MITLHEFAKIVMSMRVAQGRYFRNPDRENLISAKDWESKVDAAWREVLSTQERLF